MSAFWNVEMLNCGIFRRLCRGRLSRRLMRLDGGLPGFGWRRGGGGIMFVDRDWFGCLEGK